MSLEVMRDFAQPVLIDDTHFLAVYLQDVIVLHPGKHAADSLHRQSQVIAYIGSGHRQSK